MSTRPLRLLAITVSPPFPPTEARALRTWHLLSRLASFAEVVLVTFAGPETEPEHLDALRSAVAELVVLPSGPAPRGLLARAARQARFLVGGWVPPYAQELLEQRGLHRREGRKALEEAVSSRHELDRFDLVVLEEDAAGCLPVPDLGVARIQHRLNVFGPTVAQVRHRSLPLRLTWPLQAAAWRRYDRGLVAPATACVAVTPEVAAAVGRLSPSVPVVTVPSGTDVRALSVPPSQGSDVAFLGWMRNAPNEDAALWLANELWPPLARRFPASRLRLVGRDPPRSLLRLASERVLVTGEVDDVVESCEGARVGVVPLRSGMGIKNKTLELMGMGLPVVATPLGAEGIGAGAEDGLFVAEDREGLIEALSRLIADPVAASRLGAAARRYVTAHYGWDQIAQRYAELLVELARKGPGPREANPTAMASASGLPRTPQGASPPRARPEPADEGR